MKNLIILSLVLLFIQGQVHAQFGSSCLPEGITFDTQAQIDSFQVNYPGCSEIEGDVNIEGSSNITNLNGLNVLSSIGGNMSINGDWGTGGMSDLEGLESLTSIGGDLSITWTNLTNLSGLDNLVYIGGNIIIGGNYQLLSLSGLEGLTSVPGSIILNVYMDMDIIGNNFQDLTGLDNIASIGGDLDISANGLTDMNGLENLISIKGDLIIRKDYNLTDLNGLNGLTSVNNFILGVSGTHGGYGNPNIINLNGLDNLTTISGNLFIGLNSQLSSLQGIENLDSISGNLTIVMNNSLNTLTGIESLSFIGGNLYIYNNPALSNCEAEYICEYLSNPNGSVNIYNNAVGCNNPSELADNCGITLSCLPYGNYYFFSQADIDDFGTNYPGCYDLGGDVTIKGPDINNLTGLDQVTSINGRLAIGEPNFYQGNNPVLTSLTGLKNLTLIGGDLTINYNDTLSSLAGLDNLSTVGGNLYLTYNGVLESLSPLGELNTVGGDLYIRDNAVLEDLTGLESLTSIGGNFTIEGNPNLDSLIGMENLQTIGGALEIKWSPVKNMTGLESLYSIGGDVFLYTCNSLTSLGDLGNLNTIGGSFMLDQTALTGLEGLGNLHSIGGNLEIGIWDGLPNLTNINALQNLDSVGGFIAIRNNNSLSSLTGLDNIAPASITNLYLTGNSMLSDCQVQSLCKYLSSPNGEVFISNNNDGCNSPFQVATGCGITLPCLPYGHYIFVSQADIDYFGNNMDCSELQGSVYISGDDISNLEALSNVNSIGGELHIISNPILTTLAGLDNIDAGSIASLFINYNYSLTECEVNSVCDFLLDPHGSYSIAINAPGCNSQEEVEEACFTEVPEQSAVGGQRSAVSVFPNPFYFITTFEYQLEKTGVVTLKIYNNIGQEVTILVNEHQSKGTHEVRWNAGGMPSGIYFYRLTIPASLRSLGQADDYRLTTFSGKIVKY